MKKKFVYCRTFEGCDWHDIIETVKLISTESDLSVGDVPEAIAGDIALCFPKGMLRENELAEGIRDIFSGKKRVFRVMQFKIKKRRCGQEICLEIDMSSEFVISKEYFCIEIEEENLVYLPLRFMQAGTKPVRDIEKLLAMPTATPEKAGIAVRLEEEKGQKQTFWNYVDAKDGFGVFAADESRLEKSRWYAEETARLEITTEELLNRYLVEFLTDGREAAPSFLQFVFRCHPTAYGQVEPFWKAFLKDESTKLGKAGREAYGPVKAGTVPVS